MSTTTSRKSVAKKAKTATAAKIAKRPAAKPKAGPAKAARPAAKAAAKDRGPAKARPGAAAKPAPAGTHAAAGKHAPAARAAAGETQAARQAAATGKHAPASPAKRATAGKAAPAKTHAPGQAAATERHAPTGKRAGTGRPEPAKATALASRKAAVVGAAKAAVARAEAAKPASGAKTISGAKAPVPEPTREATAPAELAPAMAPAEPPVAPEASAAAPAPAEPPIPKKRLVPRPKLEAWEPKPLPAPRLGRPEDPRLAAAIAARERWHGRSGRPALKSATQAVAFARERRLVQVVEPTALPNLLDPILGKACLPEERVEGPTATTFRGWRKEVEVAHDLLELRLAFERPTLAQAELWPSILAVATPREEAARDGTLVLPREADEALEILDRKGSVPVDRLRSLLGLDPAQMGHLRGQLEAQLLVLARPELDEDDGPIVVLEPFGRWAARAVGPRRLELHQAFTVLFAAAVRSAAVLWPDEIAALFPWSPEERDAAVAACVQAGAVVTYDEGGSVAYVASPVPR